MTCTWAALSSLGQVLLTTAREAKRILRQSWLRVAVLLQMAYNIDVPKPNVADAVEILVDSVTNPKFLAWEVKDAVAKMKGDIATVKDNPQTVLLEVYRPTTDCCSQPDEF